MLVFTLPGQHCESCGQDVALLALDEGYTPCCNEPVCDGGVYTRVWIAGTMEPRVEQGVVRACCGAAANQQLPDGVYALRLANSDRELPPYTVPVVEQPAGPVRVREGARVHHTEKVTGGCTVEGHRNGVLTGRSRVTRGSDQAEVTLDCGHVRWPLLRVLKAGQSPASQQAKVADGRREQTERNRAALGGKPGRFYDYLRGCWMFRHLDGTEERWERSA